jgi:AcrR family transcriptional regulator
MPIPAAPRPRKRPVQSRSQATVDAILDAAARILVRDGYGAFTTNRVAAIAGVSIGSLYQYFPKKEALLAELKDRHVRALELGFEATLARVGEAPLADLVAAVVAANAEAHLLDPELHRVLSTEVPHLGASDAAGAFERRTVARVRALFETRRSELAVRDLDLAVYLVVRTVEATIHEAVVDRPDDLASGAVTREVTRLLLGYLTGPEPAGSRVRRARRPPPARRSRRRVGASAAPRR